MKPTLSIYHPVIAALIDRDTHKHLIALDPALNMLFKAVFPDSFNGLPKTPYVSLIGAVIGQIIRYNQAKIVRSKLYQIYGNDFGPVQINNLTTEQWLYIGLDPSKVEIILAINHYILSNKLSLKTADDIRKLQKVKGVGEWTITTTLLTSFMDWDIFPCGDLFIRKKIKKLYKLQKLPTITEVRNISKKWSPYRSIVAWYLWRWF